jgi:ATP-dependent Clp protease protease subunit
VSIKLTDLKQDRTLYLFNQFYQDTAEELIRDMVSLDSVSNEDINIIINSYGGSAYALLSIIDTIKNLNSKVNTVCLGIGASCGAILASIGNKRYIGENSKLMFHQVSSFAYGTIDQIENDLKESKSINEKVFQMVSERRNFKIHDR